MTTDAHETTAQELDALKVAEAVIFVLRDNDGLCLFQVGDADAPDLLDEIAVPIAAALSKAERDGQADAAEAIADYHANVGLGKRLAALREAADYAQETLRHLAGSPDVEADVFEDNGGNEALVQLDAALAAAPGGEQGACPGCDPHPPHGGECRKGEGFPPSWCGCLISAAPVTAEDEARAERVLGEPAAPQEPG